MRRGNSMHRSGFTLLELLVILGIVMIVAVLGFVGFEQMIVRTRLHGDAVGISNAIQRARALAVRETSLTGSSNVVAEAVTVAGAPDELRFFFDVNDNLTQDAGELEAQPAYVLTRARRDEASVYFWSVESDSPDPLLAMNGLTPRTGLSSVLVIRGDGKVRDLGGIRIGMGPFPRVGSADNDFGRNFMEVRVEIKATGRTQLRKFIPVPDRDDPGDEDYQRLKKKDDGSPNWKFYLGD